MLKVWINVLVTYSNHAGWEDHPYGYTERSNVGLLSAAIWKSGGTALEEWGMEKHDANGLSYSGRNDLYLIIDGDDYISEWKQKVISLSIGVSLNVIKKTIDGHKDAKYELARARVNRVTGLYGLFLIPKLIRISVKEKASNIREYINWIVDELTPDVLAWWFPEETRQHDYPGIIMRMRRPRKTLENGN